MSSGCSLINKSNYATYDGKYSTDSKRIGTCIDSKRLVYKGGTDCNEDEFACYANHKLTRMRNRLDSNLEEIYQPQNSRISIYESNYQTTMLTGVIWAMLGTTVLYYAFTKI
jgi:hypothetical protein